MKHLTMLIFLTVMMTMAPISTAAADGSEVGILVITIEGFENSDGVAKVALVNSKDNFSEENPFKGYDFKIVNNRVVETISLPYGEYAIKIFHDENSNGVLDKRLFGIPAEAYGFSNNARGTLGPPEYEAAAFKLDSSEKKITITIK